LKDKLEFISPKEVENDSAIKLEIRKAYAAENGILI